jgi:TPR repeat protein
MSLSATAVAGPFEDGVAAYLRGDYATALQILRPLADQGIAAAQYNLGVMYAEGKGVQQDYTEAVKWYRKAADQNLAIAQSNLGSLYSDGHGVPQDCAEAMKWYRRAADASDPSAQSRDYLQAHKWYSLALSSLPSWQAGLRAEIIKSRDSVEANMTPEQIAEAQRLAREWKPK